ncbi:hypothetical protein DQ04_00641080 [Trypanosoma grayi]|uniref:hypothetical protein n=1 Tax=Trypanosoma grayi TaxID=71804 RepID=UPI0004F41852|nr:hypothetical protein DQ04_00641080 [Trypanosoma grayi]KEG14064.1 hypothetical protein DQ04_00641080 [Trypanosoma grayi]
MSDAFFSPWLGMDTTDNMNLLQLVNPWSGNSWGFYTEYYQWSPTENINSNFRGTVAGHTLYGSLTYNGDQTYTLMQRDLNTGDYSTMQIPVQKYANGTYKNYTIPYIVYEKVADCQDYPPDEAVNFYEISLYCNGERIYPKWIPGAVDEVCDFAAHSDSPDVVNITWSTTSKRRPTRAQIERNKYTGLGRHHVLQVLRPRNV